MPVINGVYTKDFPALGRAPIDTDIIPIAEVANQITYKTTLGEIFNAKVFGTAGAIPKFTSANTLGDSIITELSDKIGIDIATPNNKLSINSTDPGSGLDLQIGATSYARFGIINPGIPGEPGIDNDCFIGSTINNDFLVRTNNIEALRIDTAQRLTIANIQNALADTDKFLVSEGGVVKYRTGAEVLADIGGASATGFVPYTGATSDVDLGLFDITATALIKAGGVNTQFLKADGSVDNNNYLTANDLPSTLSLYATNVAASVSGYFKLVTAIDDPDYNTIAVDVPTGAITTTEQLIASLVSPVNLINGNPGVFNVTTTGNITRLTGSGEAEFFFKIYKRDSGGVETLIGTSGNTIPVINSGYSEFFATAIWNDGIFDVTDSIVLKYYANRIAGGSNPTYQFQFGGDQPVRTIVPVPLAVIPNIYLEDLADVEDGTASNNDGIFFDSSVSLWKYKSVSEVLGYTPVPNSRTLTINSTTYDLTANRSWSVGTVTSVAALTLGTSGTDLNSSVANSTTTPVITLNVPDASATNRGVITTGSQTIAGTKTFSSDIVVNGINIGRGGGNEESNTRVGKNALIANTTGIQNTANGYFSLFNNTTGYNNTAFGHASGDNNTTGYNNIFVGMNSNGESITESNRTWIGNTETTSTWLGGNLLLGNRNNATSDKLQITGSAKITGMITLGTGADSYVYDSGGSLILQTGASARLTINSAGNTTLSGTLNGTSATFSDTIQTDGSANKYVKSTGFISNQLGQLSDFGAGDAGYYFISGGGIQFVSGGANRMQLNSSGNLGLGVTPSAWDSSYKAFQLNTQPAIWGSSDAIFLSVNQFQNTSGSNRYIANGFATQYRQDGGQHQFYTAPSGTAGNAISFTQAMTLTAGGNLGVGTASPSYRLHVTGTSAALFKLSNISANRGIVFGIDSSSEPSIQAVVDNSDVARQLSINPVGGNVLIGTTTDAGYKLDVNGTGRFSGALLVSANGSSFGSLINTSEIVNNGTNSINGIKIISSTTDSVFTGGIEFMRTTVAAGSKIEPLRDAAVGGVGLRFLTTIDNSAEASGTLTTALTLSRTGAATFSSSVLIGTTSTTGIATGSSVNAGVFINAGVVNSQVNNNSNQYWSKATGYTSGDYTAHFVNGDYVGGISTNGSSTNYATASDYRLKKDLKDFNGLTLLSKIKTYDYEWESDKSRMYGVVAHELQEIIPYAVTGEKDAERMQGVDYSKLVPVMIKAIQELKAEIELLKNK